MKYLAGSRRVGLYMTVCLAVLFVAGVGHAEQRPSSKAAKSRTVDHTHDPVVIDSRPIISKYDVSLVRPRRVLLTKRGLFVADFDAGTVVRIAPNGRSKVVVEGLNEPAGLAADSTGQVYVSTFAQGMPKEGTIVQIGRNDVTAVYATGLNGPTVLAFDSRDRLHVASLTDNVVSRVNGMSESITLATNIPAPSGMVFNANGDLFVLSASEGSVYRVSAGMTDGMTDLARIASGLAAPSDLVAHPSGQMIAVDYGRRRLVSISPKGRIKLFALVPRGTVAATFDSLGNLIIANADDHSLVKVTSNLRIKCPHCGRRIPVRLRPRSTRQSRPKSEDKPMPPVI